MAIHVISPGANTTVQDLGRPGFQNSGFGVGGVMDPVAMKRANLLANNQDNEAVLEFCLVGPMLSFDEETNVVVSGGDFSISMNGVNYPAEKVVHVLPGDTIMVMPGRTGTFGVLAFCGGLAVDPVMGSASTNVKCRIGGFRGRALKAGDQLELKNRGYGRQNLSNRSLPPRELPDMKKVQEIRVIAGPQDDLFTEEGLQTFYSSEYTMTNQSDRMGFRFDGPQVETKNGSDIISDGIALGSIQIPGSGMPIVMMADRQTTGGYAKIATVAGIDIPTLAQARPGTRVHFTAITASEAQKLLREQDTEWKKTKRSLILPLFNRR